MSPAQAILLGIRPPTLLLGISPVLLGSALGYRYLVEHLQGNPNLTNIMSFVAALLLALLLQAGANLVNDVKDAESGVDTEERLGPKRMVQSGLLKAATARKAYRWMFMGAVAIGLLLAFSGGWPVVVLPLICAAVAYLYTGGPKPLSHLGLGEFVALMFFGPVAVLGSAYLQSSHWQFADLLWASGPGFLAAAVMAINNLRDRRGDLQSGKYTLAVRFGDPFGEKLPWQLIRISLGIFVLYCVVNSNWVQGLLLAALLLLLSQRYVRPLLFPRADLLNKALKATSLFVVVYCLAYVWVVLG